jgi:hypothetical protein
MIGLPLQLSSPSRMVYPWLLPCLAVVVILLPGLSVWANDRGDDRDEEEAGFNWEHQGPRICSNTAQVAFNACGHDNKDNFWIAYEKCLNNEGKRVPGTVFVKRRLNFERHRTCVGNKKWRVAIFVKR